MIDGYKKHYTSLPLEKVEEMVDDLLLEVDSNNNGEVDFSEFLVAALNKENNLKDQKLKQCFDLFDENNDGFIGLEELKSKLAGVKLSDEELKELIGEVDKDGDFKISYSEFKNFMGKL